MWLGIYFAIGLVNARIVFTPERRDERLASEDEDLNVAITVVICLWPLVILFAVGYSLARLSRKFVTFNLSQSLDLRNAPRRLKKIEKELGDDERGS